ncbi:hypothetical protein EI77_02527 [Prosthecobacter fusiformis]|uniref:Nucleotide-diphospho-sugar transferase n=1 Tax=Prosthecobacter fusiformis TaxID=48464 RepID=A0A4V3FFN4_9BACT|nr:hypothetical protein [Prosthecobacter fusiformis]TDU71403.1 hypothetical protein EI77_02527 [Prosthecobacter fusiformis]
MKSIHNRIVYLALGNSYVSQAIFSLLTLAQVYRGQRPDMEVVVYSDSSASFHGLRRFFDLMTVDVNGERLVKMKGLHRDVLRAKIMTLQETMERGDANLIYVDTDTIFLCKIDRLFTEIGSGRLFLHKPEWPLRRGRMIHPELCPSDISFDLKSGTKIKISESSVMWNSGVVGINAGRKTLVDDVLSLHHQFYAIYPTWHVEQFCYSLILANAGNLKGCRKFIFHYWHSKQITSLYTNVVESHASIDERTLLKAVNRCKIRMIWTGRALYYGYRIRLWIRNLPGVYILFVSVRDLIKYLFTIASQQTQFKK